jgi:Tfp pilus assembly major pilin PilA
VIFCYGCGQQIHESAPVCPHCGAPQKTASTAAASSGSDTIPPGIKGWSWGAFLLNGFWAIGNRTWIGLLAFIPYVGFIMSIILGIKGREWAWKNKAWESVEQFNAVQRKWSMWGVIIMVGVLVIGIMAAIFIPAYHQYQQRQHSETAEQTDTPALVHQDLSTLEAPSDAPAPTTASTPVSLPFVGKRDFNFLGGTGTGQTIAIAADGTTEIHFCGDLATGGTCILAYSGPYQSNMQAADGTGWLIEGEKIYATINGQIDSTCGDDGQQPCYTDLE